MDIEKKIKKALKEGKVVLGTRSVLSGLKNGKISSVIYAQNTPQHTLRDLEYYTLVSGVSMEKFSGNSTQLGETCGKPFGILLLGIKQQ